MFWDQDKSYNLVGAWARPTCLAGLGESPGEVGVCVCECVCVCAHVCVAVAHPRDTDIGSSHIWGLLLQCVHCC